MDRDSGDARVWFCGPRPRQDVGRCLAHGLFAGQVEPDTADVGLVDNVWRLDLDGHRAAAGELRGGCRRSLSGITRENRRCDRNRIAREQI